MTSFRLRTWIESVAGTSENTENDPNKKNTMMNRKFLNTVVTIWRWINRSNSSRKWPHKGKIIVVFADVSSLFPRKLLKIDCCLAGLLTYSRFWTPSRFGLMVNRLMGDSFIQTINYQLSTVNWIPVAKVLFKTFKELTAAGLYRNYTCFPFNSVHEKPWTKTKAGAKVVSFFEIEKSLYHYYLNSRYSRLILVVIIQQNMLSKNSWFLFLKLKAYRMSYTSSSRKAL